MVGLIFAVLGIVILVKDQVKVSSARVVRGFPARCLGLMYLAPLPVGLASGFVAEGLTVLVGILTTIAAVIFAKGAAPVTSAESKSH